MGVSKYGRKFFDAIGGAAFGEFVRKILRVVVGQLHSVGKFLIIYHLRAIVASG